MTCKDEGRACRAALSFLTRFGAPLLLEDHVLARAVRYYAVAGLAVGLLCCGLVRVAVFFGAHNPWPLAWLYVACALWVTRGLHMDGLADVGDAWGSGARGEHFWRILRDSRLGAFGGMALVLGLLGLLLGAQAHLEKGHWLPLLVAPVYGRNLAVLLAFAVVPHDPLSLGGKACAGATGPVAVVYALLTLLCLTILPAAQGWTAVTGTVLWFTALYQLARREDGVNGDFMGAAIVGGEVFFLLSW